MSATPQPLDTVLDRARDGDPEAFDTLYCAHRRAVVGYLRARGVRDADDLANEIFVRAFRNIRTVRGDAERFRSWLFGIAHNAAVDDARRRRRRPDETPLDTNVVPSGGDVEDEAGIALERHQVLALLGDLAPDQRDVLLLLIVADLSVSQTAGVLDKSYEAVKALERRGLAALRRRLESSPDVAR